MSDFFRCSCPITSALDIVGDKWSLVIIKQMLFEQKRTFKDFTSSKESIATNILSSRLKMLEDFKIVNKFKHPTNKKTNLYQLTDKGLALTPVVMELTLWSKDHLQEFHHHMNLDNQLEAVRKDKEKYYPLIIENYKNWLSSLEE